MRRIASAPSGRCVGETPCRCGRCQLGASCFQPGQNRRSPLGSTGGCFTAIRPTSPGAAGSVGHSCRIKGAPQQARVLAALRAAPACRGRFAPLTRHPFGFCPSPFAGSIPLRGPRLVPSIIAPGHTSLGPLLHLPERGIAPRCLTAPAWGRLSCCPPLVCETTCPTLNVATIPASLRNAHRGVFKTPQTPWGVQAFKNAL